VVVEPGHTLGNPRIPEGEAFMVITLEVDTEPQPFDTVYVMVSVPSVRPWKSPVKEPIVPILVLTLCQNPPDILPE
jgi:hypothetical protein